MCVLMAEVKTAVVGVGNCCSALIQGVELLKSKRGMEETVPGLLHPVVGGYTPSDIRFVAAFDVDSRKVGKDLSQAIFTQPNAVLKFFEVPHLDVKVLRGEPLDGVGKFVKDVVTVAPAPPVDVAQVLRETKAEVVVNLLPSGALKASSWYAEAALKAGSGFVNATPSMVASGRGWAKRFREARLPVAGDDLMDQIGSTMLHKAIFETLHRRGVRIEKSYALDIGGGTENLNALERERNILKRRIKASSIQSVVPYPVSLATGTTDYVGFMGNTRTSYLWVEGSYFAGTPVQMDIKVSTVDAPNGCNVLIDVIRGVKLGLDRGLAGPLVSVSAYGFKKPVKPMPPVQAMNRFEAFAKGTRMD